MNTLEVRSIKVTIPIQAEELPTDCIAPDGQKAEPIKMTFKSGDIALVATLNGKSYKKQMKKVEPGAFAVIQGKLGANNEMIECGITIQPPKQKAE